MDTFMAKTAEIDRKWYIVDAAGKAVGRVAAEVAKVLRGKHKPTFTPHMDTGDHVIVINASQLVFTGNKATQKTYFRHSGYQSGAKYTVAGKLLASRPERVMEMAVKGMLPKNRLGADMYRKLKVYAGAEHPHAAQQPEILEINVR
ncbi:MAG: 50S ribosomal protein L13 [Negativicutes bacterium]|nr:50S ribosomal protein L13 [Negativicutes bacterium]